MSRTLDWTTTDALHNKSSETRKGIGDDRAPTGAGRVTTPPPGQWPPSQPPPEPWADSSDGPRGTGISGQLPTAPQKSSNTAKWVLAGLAVLVIVVVTVVATTLVVRGGSDSSNAPSAQQSTAVDDSDIASANDRGPAGIILDDPTCQSWTPIAAAFGHASGGGWDRRDPAVPATAWTPEQQAQYQAVEVALKDGADRTVELARETPHRVMRQLYEQFIAYSREYVSRIDAYTEKADLFARVTVSAAEALSGVCGAITYGAAGARAPLVPSARPPMKALRPADPTNPNFFLVEPNSTCAQWLLAVDKFLADTEPWRSIDPNTPIHELTQDERAINAAMMPIMESFATDTQLLGAESENSVWADFATLSAQYRRAYVSALPTYAVADDYLQLAAGSVVGLISSACEAVGA